jgi:hypothetical protein
MPTRKILDHPFKMLLKPCNHPEHDPPKHMVFENGLWEHECPACHTKQFFTVNKPTF